MIRPRFGGGGYRSDPPKWFLWLMYLLMLVLVGECVAFVREVAR